MESVKIPFTVGLLEDALTPAEKVISRTALLPVLRCVLLKVEGQQLEIVSSNLEQTVRTKASLQQPAPASVVAAIPAKTLAQLLNTLPSDLTVELEFHSTPPSVTIHTPTGKYTLGGENPGEFPELPTPPETPVFKVPSAILKEGIESTLYAVSKDEDNPQTRPLTGIRFEVVPGEGVWLVGSDAHRLVRFPMPEAEAMAQSEFTIPRKACQPLRQILPAQDLPVTVYVQNPYAFIDMGPVQFITQLIEEPYPDYRVAIPEQTPSNQFTASTDELLKIVKRLSLFTDKTGGLIYIDLDPERGVTFWAEDPELNNKAEERAPAAYSGEQMRVALDSKFLTELLNEFPAESSTFYFQAPNMPVMVTPADATARNVFALVMPVSIGESEPAVEEES